MGDLHSIAYSSSCSSSLGCWDYFNNSHLGVFNADMSHFMESTPPLLSDFDSDFSTGYLQDALFEFTDRPKRRRLLLFSDDQSGERNSKLMQSYWDSNLTQNNCLEDFSYLSQITSFNGVSGEPVNSSVSRMSTEDASIFTEMKSPYQEEENSASEVFDSPSSSVKDSLNSQPLPEKETLYPLDPNISPSEKRKKRVTKRVVYPFAVVKPGGIEGDVTLNDINERIQMPPTRPVKHPVGDYACRPLVSPEGPGLSGKAVVAFTRLHTQGRGTITIIRTKD